MACQDYAGRGVIRWTFITSQIRSRVCIRADYRGPQKCSKCDSIACESCLMRCTECGAPDLYCMQCVTRDRLTPLESMESIVASHGGDRRTRRKNTRVESQQECPRVFERVRSTSRSSDFENVVGSMDLDCTASGAENQDEEIFKCIVICKHH